MVNWPKTVREQILEEDTQPLAQKEFFEILNSQPKAPMTLLERRLIATMIMFLLMPPLKKNDSF